MHGLAHGIGALHACWVAPTAFVMPMLSQYGTMHACMHDTYRSSRALWMSWRVIASASAEGMDMGEPA